MLKLYKHRIHENYYVVNEDLQYYRGLGKHKVEGMNDNNREMKPEYFDHSVWHELYSLQNLPQHCIEDLTNFEYLNLVGKK